MNGHSGRSILYHTILYFAILQQGLYANGYPKPQNTVNPTPQKKPKP